MMNVVTSFEKRNFTQALVKISVISTIVNQREVIGYLYCFSVSGKLKLSLLTSRSYKEGVEA